MVYDKRVNNQAIKSRHDLQMAILLQKSPPSKSDEYDKFPLSSQLGFIHAIPEMNSVLHLPQSLILVSLDYFQKRFFKHYGNMKEN
jgi:hypothetical protein